LPAKFKAHFIVSAEMYASLEAGLSTIFSLLPEVCFFRGKEIIIKLAHQTTHGCMAGRIAGKWRSDHQGRAKGGIILIRPNTPVGILSIPTSYKAIVQSYSRNCIQPCCPGWIKVNVILEYFFAQYFIPEVLAGPIKGIRHG